MTEHSPEAIAAYPDEAGSTPLTEHAERMRTAFDRGRVLTLTAKREELIDLINKVDVEGRWQNIFREEQEAIADALLAPGGPLHEERDVRETSEYQDLLMDRNGWKQQAANLFRQLNINE